VRSRWPPGITLERPVEEQNASPCEHQSEDEIQDVHVQGTHLCSSIYAVYRPPRAASVGLPSRLRRRGPLPHTRPRESSTQLKRLPRERGLARLRPVRAHLVKACAAAAIASATLGLASSIHAAGSMPSFAGCFGAAPQIRPTSILVACGDGNFFLTGIKWSNWSTTSAAAVATGHQNDCKPFCAGGHFSLYRVAVGLSRPRTCRNGRSEFTRFTYRFLSRKPPGVVRGGTFKSPFYRGSGCP
jgi:hypothetical protein